MTIITASPGVLSRKGLVPWLDALDEEIRGRLIEKASGRAVPMTPRSENEFARFACGGGRWH